MGLYLLMILLDGQYAFDDKGDGEISHLRRPSSRRDSITGYLISTQSRYVRWRFNCNLLVGKDDLEVLQQFFAESDDVFDFVDWRGFSWLTQTGTNNSSHAYSTGALFDQDELVPQPQDQNGYLAYCQHWIVPVSFVVNARGLSGQSAGIIGDDMLQTETPGGTINGVNDTFTTLAAYGTIMLFKNVGLMVEGVDYTYSGTIITITAGSIPETGDSLRFFYVA